MMLALGRTLHNFQNRNYVLSHLKCIYSRRISSVTHMSYKDPTSKTVAEKKGYGEKDINLLEEIDKTMPLPGQMTALPLILSYTTKIQDLPTPVGKRWKTSIPLAEENHRFIFDQYGDQTERVAKLHVRKNVEFRVHECPMLLRRDFQHLFPSRYIDNNLAVVTFCLKTQHDMSTWSEEAEEEREMLTRYFIFAAKCITQKIAKKEFWSDFIDPKTGKPHSSPLVDDHMFETDLRYRNFGLQIQDLGCCRIISHPIWGTNVFVGAIFSNAPIKFLETVFNLNKEESVYPVWAKAKKAFF